MNLSEHIAASEQRAERLATLERVEMWCARRTAEALYDWRENRALTPGERSQRLIDFQDWAWAWRCVLALKDVRQLVMPYEERKP